MNPERILTAAVLEKFLEQADLTGRLVSLIPADRLDWAPATFPPAAGAGPFRLDELLGHLLECLAGVCAVLHAMHPRALAHLAELRSQVTNHRCAPEEASARLRAYAAHIAEGFALTVDADLGRSIPTVFVPRGEAALTLLLGNLEHLVNHKHQLFFYLRLLGLPVGTKDLYRLRGDAGS